MGTSVSPCPHVPTAPAAQRVIRRRRRRRRRRETQVRGVQAPRVPDERRGLVLRRVLLRRPHARGLHSPSFQLNVSTFCSMCWGALLVSVTNTAQVEQRCGRV